MNLSSTKEAVSRSRHAAFVQPATQSTPETGAESDHQQTNSSSSADHAVAGYERMVENTHSELNALGNIIDQRSKVQAAQKPFQSSLLFKLRSLKESHLLRARASRFVLTIGHINLTDWDLCTRLNHRAHTIPQLVDDMGKNGSMNQGLKEFQ